MKKKYMKITLLLLTAFFCLQGAMAKVWYVNSPTTSWTGKNPGDVVADIKDIFKAGSTVVENDELWFARGSFSLDETFVISKKVSVYGGFAGTESKVEERQKIAGGKLWDFVNETILDGRNGKRVVNIIVKDVILDGFTVINGKTTGSTDDTDSGAGIHVKMSINGGTIRNCVVRNNVADKRPGGGISLRSNYTVENCLIKNNICGGAGGGVALYSSGGASLKNSEIHDNKGTDGGGVYLYSGTVENCILTNNEGTQGGGIYLRSSGDCKAYNCLIVSNIATKSGGGVGFQEVNKASLHNCTVVNNSVSSGAFGGGIAYVKTPTGINIKNTIIWGNKKAGSLEQIAAAPNQKSDNSSMVYSAIQAATVTGTGNVALTQDSAVIWGKDWNLGAQSPCVDAGTSDGVNLTVDLAGQPRTIGGSMDMGAYERILYPGANDVFYVNLVAAGKNDGSSWLNAFTQIQQGIDAAMAYNMAANKQAVVWVSAGEYQLEKTIELKEGVSLFGGFKGTENNLGERQTKSGGKVWEFLNPTIVKAGEGKNIRIMSSLNNNFKAAMYINGFTITGGYATGSSDNDKSGGGIHLMNNMFVQCCIITGNEADGNGGGISLRGGGISGVESSLIENNSTKTNGGGVALYAESTKAYIKNSEIRDNSADGNGGGIFNFQGIVETCIVSTNKADQGGGIYFRQYGGSSVVNSLITENQAKTKGGAICCYTDKNANIYNCTVVANMVEETGSDAAVGYLTPPVNIAIVNSIFWGNKKGTVSDALAENSKMTYSAAEGSVAPAGEGNIAITDSAAFFGKDWYLAETSPGKDAGKDIASLPGLDLAGAMRVQNGTIDMGAYESGVLYRPDEHGIIYVKSGAGLDHEGNSWEDAIGDINFAINIARLYNEKIAVGQARATIWVAAGNYDLTAPVGLINGVSLYGGFAGMETALGGRAKGTEAWNYTQPTVLNGKTDRSVPMLEQKNDFTVATIVDGFTIQQGKTGASLMGNITLRNCILANNGKLNGTIGTEDGGGIAAKNACVIESCLVENNTAKNGGGIAIFAAGPVVRHCLVQNNTANGDGFGGGIFNSKGIVENSVIKENTAIKGGGIFVSYNDARFYNCLLENNHAVYGGGLAYEDGNDNAASAGVYNLTVVNNESTTAGGGAYFGKTGQNLVNTVLWGNKNGGAAQEYAVAADIVPVIQNCAILCEVANLPEGNNVVLPAERSAVFEQNGWTLCENSLCEDKGKNIDGLPATDLAGIKRTQGRTTDIGAYERQSDFYYHLSDKGILYVIDGQDGAGADWNNAVGDLQLALRLASAYNDTVSLGRPRAQIWVAAGEYQLSAALDLVGGINMYGGFAGTEDKLEARAKGVEKWNYTHVSLIKGKADRSFNILNQLADFKTQTLVDGFTLEEGKSGANLLGNVTLTNCVLRNNGQADGSGFGKFDGGGVAAKNACVIENCLMENNIAKNGGGIAINEAGVIVRNCLIQNNVANGSGWGWGGGIFNNCGTVENCIVKNNTAEKGGGVFIRKNASLSYNCIVEGNRAAYGGGVTYESRNDDAKTAKIYNFTVINNESTTAGGGVYFVKTGQTVINTILWGNKNAEAAEEYAVATGVLPVIQNCAILMNAASLPSGNNIALPAESSKVFGENWTLAASSPCIDKGQEVTGLPETDVYGNRRKSAGINDIGACELQKVLEFTADENGVFYVKTGVPQGKGNSWDSPVNSLETALKAVKLWQDEYKKIAQIWVAKGTYLLGTPVAPQDGVNIYGGFSGDKVETVESREKGKNPWDFTNETILDAVGRIQCLVQAKDFATLTLIDGLTLKNGLGKTPASNAHKVPGGAALMKRASLQYCKIIDCKNGGVFFTEASQMIGCYLFGNSSLNDGGAINLEFGTIDGCLFERNTTAKDGGGASITYSGTAKNCIFKDNKAEGSAGGFKLHNGGTAVNCLVEGNEAKKGGGFMFSGSANSSYAKAGTITNLTVVNNRALNKGGAFLAACMVADRDLSISNTIFWNNTSAGQPGNMAEIEAPSTYTLDNCFVMEGEIRVDRDSNNVTYPAGTPKEQIFNEDWRLTITSPCVDKGRNNAGSILGKDLAGNPRISNSIADIGAYEYQDQLDNFTIDYINETIAQKDSEATVECSSQHTEWNTVPFDELIAKEKRVIYCRVDGTVSEIQIAGRGEPAAKIDFAQEKLVDVVANSEWDIRNSSVFEKIDHVDLGAYIGSDAKTFIVRQPAAEKAFKTEKEYPLPARRVAPGLTLDYVAEALQGGEGMDMTRFEVSNGNAYVGLEEKAVVSEVILGIAEAATFTLSVRLKADEDDFASADQEFLLNGRPVAPEFSIDFAISKTKEIVPAIVEYDTVSTFITKVMGTEEPLVLKPGKNYYFRVGASAELNIFASSVFTLNVPAIPAMGAIVLDYQAEKLLSLPAYAVWDYGTVVGEDAKEDISSLVSDIEDVTVKIYVPVGENTFAGEPNEIVLPKRPAAPDYVLDYSDERIVTKDEGVTPGNWEVKNTDVFELVDENGSISKYIPQVGAQHVVLTLRSAAGDGVFHSKETVITFVARPEKPILAVNYETETTTTPVTAGMEYSVYEDMAEATRGGDTLLTLTPGIDFYFSIKATANTFRSEPYHLIVSDRPSINEVTIDFLTEKLDGLPAGTLWKINDGEALLAQEDIRGIIPEVGAEDAMLTIWTPGSENRFSSQTLSLSLPARPATPVVSIDYEKEVLNGVVKGMVWKKGGSENFEVVNADIKNLIPAYGEADLMFTNVRIAASDNNFQSGETNFILKPRQGDIRRYSIDYMAETTVEPVEVGIEYVDIEKMDDVQQGINENISLVPGRDFYFRRRASNEAEVFSSLAFLLKVPGRPVIIMEDMNKEMGDLSFTPELWNSWNNTAQGVTLKSSDTTVAVVAGQIITLKSNGECQITASMAANVDGQHFAAEDKTVTLRVGAGIVTGEEDVKLPDLKIANGSMDMTFRLDKLGNIENAKLVFFNRSGKVIFESKNYGNDFDMGHLDAGTYYYVLTYRAGGEQKVKKGFVEIIR